jgi:hypothetical protein
MTARTGDDRVSGAADAVPPFRETSSLVIRNDREGVQVVAQQSVAYDLAAGNTEPDIRRRFEQRVDSFREM